MLRAAYLTVTVLQRQRQRAHPQVRSRLRESPPSIRSSFVCMAAARHGARLAAGSRARRGTLRYAVCCAGC